jgi:hypothetical protein
MQLFDQSASLFDSDIPFENLPWKALPSESEFLQSLLQHA